MPRSVAIRNSNALAAPCAIWSVEIIMAAVLLSRRLAGGFTSPSNGWMACAAATVAVLFSVVAFRGSRRLRRGAVADGLAVFATLVPPFTMALPLLPVVATVAVWYLVGLFSFSFMALLSIILTERSEAERIAVVQIDKVTTQSRREVDSTEMSSLEAALLSSADELLNERLLSPESISLVLPEVESDSADAEPDCHVSQWMKRGRSPEGGEFIEGGLTLRFSSGQSHAVAHLPLQPALAAIPEVECEVLDNASVRLKVAARQAYGIRIEARRSGETSEETTAQIGFLVSEIAATRSVA
jgi:hypothetical protein